MTRHVKIGLVVALLVTLIGGTMCVSAAEDAPRRGGRVQRRREQAEEPAAEDAARRGRHGGRRRALAEKLELTDEQKASIREIVKGYADEIEAAREEVSEKRQAMRNLVRADEVDERAIRKAGVDLGAAIANAAVLRANIHSEIREVLTEEQREKADELLDDVQKRGEGPRKRAGQHRDNL